ncbi:hypothetical protein SAMN04489762_1054 [Terribacillus saccharophilus]|uniref:Uncharacterized protein n=1 Tax=Terribacillus saccharophilus TaxID=361277 RepID=A0AAX2ED84_9BACI|nr:hypothetical protein SAMN04489762_1054 [Terribacillus saccharophilus]
MILVHGKIKSDLRSEDQIDFEIRLDVEGITEDEMPISESTRLIVNAINKKYGKNYSFNSYINPLRVKELNKLPDDDLERRMRHLIQIHAIRDILIENGLITHEDYIKKVREKIPGLELKNKVVEKSLYDNFPE